MALTAAGRAMMAALDDDEAEHGEPVLNRLPMMPVSHVAKKPTASSSDVDPSPPRSSMSHASEEKLVSSRTKVLPSLKAALAVKSDSVASAVELLHARSIWLVTGYMSAFLAGLSKQPLTFLSGIVYFFFGVGVPALEPHDIARVERQLRSADNQAGGHPAIAVEVASSQPSACPLVPVFVLESPHAAPRELPPQMDVSEHVGLDRYFVLRGVGLTQPTSCAMLMSWGRQLSDLNQSLGLDSKSARQSDFGERFLAQLHMSCDAVNNRHFRALLRVPSFVQGERFASFLHAFVYQLKRPDEECRKRLSQAFPRLGCVLARIVDVDRATWLAGDGLPSVTPLASGQTLRTQLSASQNSLLVQQDDALAAGVEHLSITAPLLFSLFKKNYPGVEPFLHRVALLDAQITNEEGDRQIIAWRLERNPDETGVLFSVSASKTGRHLLWRNSNTLLPVTPFEKFDFDLTKGRALFLRVKLCATFLGISISLPSAVLRLTPHCDQTATGCSSSLTITIETLTSTALTDMGLLLLGLQGLFKTVKDSLRIVLTLNSSEHDGGERKWAGVEELQISSLSVNAEVKVPQSSLLRAYTIRRMPAYVDRLLHMGAFFRDVYNALHTDVGTMFGL